MSKTSETPDPYPFWPGDHAPVYYCFAEWLSESLKITRHRWIKGERHPIKYEWHKEPLPVVGSEVESNERAQADSKKAF